MTQRRSPSEAPRQTSGNSFAGASPTTTELLAEGYERWLGPLSAYVSRYAVGSPVRERIVRQVLAENLDLLVGRRDKASEISRLKAAANRLIAEVLTGEDAVRRRLRESNGGAEHPHDSLPTDRSRPR